MQELQKRLTELEDDFLVAYERLKIEEKLAKLAKLEEEVAVPEIWNNVEEATSKNQELARINDETQPWRLLKTQIEDLKELFEMSDDSLKDEMAGQVEAMEKNFEELKKALRFNGPYDDKDAIIRITAGAGGTEAMDWSGMRERMYLSFVERKMSKVSTL